MVEALPNPGWHPTRLVYYADGKVDFMVGPVSALGQDSYDRPFRVLLDKDNLAVEVVMAGVGWAPPSSEQFDECVNWFYAAALMWAKYLVRDEPWSAKIRDLQPMPSASGPWARTGYAKRLLRSWTRAVISTQRSPWTWTHRTSRCSRTPARHPADA